MPACPYRCTSVNSSQFDAELVGGACETAANDAATLLVGPHQKLAEQTSIGDQIVVSGVDDANRASHGTTPGGEAMSVRRQGGGRASVPTPHYMYSTLAPDLFRRDRHEVRKVPPRVGTKSGGRPKGAGTRRAARKPSNFSRIRGGGHPG